MELTHRTTAGDRPAADLPYRLSLDQLALASGLYARAFFDDPLFCFILPDPGSRLEKLGYIFDFTLDGGCRYGEILALGTPMKGTATLLPPGDTDFSPWQQLISGGLRMCGRVGIGPIGRLSHFHDFSVALQRRHMPEPHRYLELLGVEPDFQGRGYGGKLIDAILRTQKEEGLPLYLETENRKNLPFYTARGFEIVEATQLPKTTVPVWALAWYP